MGGTTDLLVATLEDATRGDDRAARERLRRIEGGTAAAIQEFFGSEAEEIRRQVAENFDDLARMASAIAVLRSVPAAGRDRFLAHGERISAAVVARALQARGLPAVAFDAGEILITDGRFSRAQPDFP
jgi:aspartokinase/homoserine dehydrogenase 1